MVIFDNPARKIHSNGMIQILVLSIMILLSEEMAVAQETWVPTAESQVTIKIGFTLGTHELKSKVIRGSLAQNGNLQDLTGQLSVPIREIKEGSPKLECHLQSSLGLDYSKSDFPGDHVCDSDHRLPEKGQNAISFPDVSLTVTGLKKVSENNYTVEGDWIIHGVSRPTENLTATVTHTGEILTLEGETSIKLKDFGIIVKKAFVISVSDTAKVKWNLKFAHQKDLK